MNEQLRHCQFSVTQDLDAGEGISEASARLDDWLSRFHDARRALSTVWHPTAASRGGDTHEPSRRRLTGHGGYDPNISGRRCY